jgi:predicted RecA/RadA family phage recombinase
MATNYIQPGKTVTLAAPYDRLSGEGAQVGSLFGVALQTVLSTVEGEFGTVGVWDLDKTSAQAWTQGQKIYWDNSNKRCDSDSTLGMLIGVATEVADNPSSTGKVRLNGVSPATAEGAQGAIVALTDSTGGSGGHDDTLADGLTAAALTEDGGAIGGSNDGDIPDLAATAAALTENSGAIGGSQDGDITTLVDPSGDSGASLIDGVRECAVMINTLVTDVDALRAAARENATMINTLVTDTTVQNQNDSDLAQKVNEIRTALIAAGILQA